MLILIAAAGLQAGAGGPVHAGSPAQALEDADDGSGISICRGSAPWRAQAGSEWCMLCQLSPSESRADGGGSGIGAQQHGSPSRSGRPRCPDPGTARQGNSCCSLPGPALSRNPDGPVRRHDRLVTSGPVTRTTPPDAHGVVAHENGYRPPVPHRHAHAERRQPPGTYSNRMARNNHVSGSALMSIRGAGCGVAT